MTEQDIQEDIRWKYPARNLQLQIISQGNLLQSFVNIPIEKRLPPKKISNTELKKSINLSKPYKFKQIKMPQLDIQREIIMMKRKRAASEYQQQSEIQRGYEQELNSGIRYQVDFKKGDLQRSQCKSLSIENMNRQIEIKNIKINEEIALPMFLPKIKDAIKHERKQSINKPMRSYKEVQSISQRVQLHLQEIQCSQFFQRNLRKIQR
ncbi:hypothetical protein pb186bvf_011537 [Paramecium bursaria]